VMCPNLGEAQAGEEAFRHVRVGFGSRIGFQER
jgi:hypothetical protein